MKLKTLALLIVPAAVVLLMFMLGLYAPDRLMAASDYRPFAYRVLTWWALRLLVALGLAPLQAAALIGTVSLVSFIAALHWLAAGVGMHLRPAHLGMAVMGTLLLMLGGSQLYDLPTLALFTACLAAMAHRKWLAYAGLFVLASLNRETSILLAVVYALQMGWDYGLLIQAAVYGLVQLGIRAGLAGLPGDSVQLHWVEHLVELNRNVPTAVLYLVAAVVLLLLVRRGFEHKPKLLRVAAMVITPALVVSYFLIGYPFEMRVFHEAYPALALLALAGQG